MNCGQDKANDIWMIKLWSTKKFQSYVIKVSTILLAIAFEFQEDMAHCYAIIIECIIIMECPLVNTIALEMVLKSHLLFKPNLKRIKN